MVYHDQDVMFHASLTHGISFFLLYSPAEPEREPDLWKEPPLPPIKPGTTVLVPSMSGGPLAGQYSTSPASDAEGTSDQDEE